MSQVVRLFDYTIGASLSDISNAEMFEWAEKQRALASHMSDAELARAVLEVMGSVSAAESEFSSGSKEDTATYNMERGVLREAAFRIAKVRDYE
jgi:hypothetical protein